MRRIVDGRAVLRSLRLQNFRCFAQAAIDLPETGAIFIGDNAQGKTSLLEAICVLVRLQSPRTHWLKQLIRFEAPLFGVAGESFGHENRVIYAKADGIGLKSDGEELSGSADYLSRSGLVVWMANDDLKLVRGPGEDRRHYLDFIGMQISAGYRRAATRYRKALKARNALLKDRKATRKSIAAYTEILANEGQVIQDAREQLIEALRPLASAAQTAVSGSSEELEIRYERSGGADLKSALDEAVDHDLDRRMTTIGPHRDDVKIALNSLTAKDYSSEGQQRTAVLALKLAQGDLLRQKGTHLPVYLIDDVFGELDAARRNALMQHIPAEAQCFVTTTSLDWLKASERKWPVMTVSCGNVSC